MSIETANIKAYLVGGGIASFAAAAFLIRDGNIPGKNIYILEADDITGGSLDGAGQADAGYVIRGGRMLNFTYRCTYDLLADIPSLTDPRKSVYEEIMAFNDQVKTHAQARLVDKNAVIQDVSSMGFKERDRIDLIELFAIPEDVLGTRRIDEWFQPAFFQTNFWLMWCTTFAFQPWHSAVEFKRYLIRFIHEFPRIHTLAGVDRTPLNQFDSIIRPMQTWLKEQGVQFIMGARVTDIGFIPGIKEKTAEKIFYRHNGQAHTISMAPHDLVFVTNGSMTAGSTLGSMTTAPAPAAAGDNGSWALWKTLAGKYSDFGRPYVFNSRIEEAKWASFTITSKGHLFFQLMEQFSGNKPGTGALVTLKDSSWLLSIVLAYQPHFLQQPEGVTVCWSYGLFPDKTGDYVKKKMSECTGEEILEELIHHLQFTAHKASLLAEANCIPCMMPYITSQFLTRAKGDRPLVIPKGATNFAFLGQFTEIPDDVVFTVEYSVRSAQMAVYGLLDLDRTPPAIYKGQHDIKVLYQTMRTMHR
ncbi:oleate hydratase [Chitinophaga nivalis]|uniref:Oleate hydratase n=1 Tax=Chitinophaga nivalis TaxID=2991709 RepID=A0ABT3IQ83_9BACT|nr:oleate hydratase [Chitinophaga nivalis]MCW3464405.1 oleate hydratase [Chitinophaga nivalis]MCW3485904.1 oleate hydratase [Chitinophaga nivalis]